MDILTVLMIQMKDGVILNMILMLLLPVITGKILIKQKNVLFQKFIFTSNCTLPNCFCSTDGTLIPNGMLPTDVPQVILS